VARNRSAAVLGGCPAGVPARPTEGHCRTRLPLDQSHLDAQQFHIPHEVIMLAYLFVLLAIAVRFLPHPLAFTPVMAALLYFGARGSRRQLWIPLVLVAASDVVLTKLVYSYPFSWDHFVTWAWYAAILGLGTSMRENTSALRVGLSAIAGSVSFFVVSNFAVWAAWSMYPKTLAGLAACYTAALPFFRRGFEGDMLFTAVVFGVPAAAGAIARWMVRAHNTPRAA
jgi:hypothetical protein